MPKQYLHMVNRYISFSYFIPVLVIFNIFVKIMSLGFMNLSVFNHLNLSLVLLVSAYFSFIYHLIFASRKMKVILVMGVYILSFILGFIIVDRLVPFLHLTFSLTVILILWLHHSIQIRILKRNPFFYSVPRMDAFRKKLYFIKRDDLSVLKFYPYSIEAETAKQWIAYKPDPLFGIFLFILLVTSCFISAVMELTIIAKWGHFLSFFVALLMICFYSCRFANQFKTGL